MEDSVCKFLGGSAMAVAVFVAALLLLFIYEKLRHPKLGEKAVTKDFSQLFMMMLIPLILAGGAAAMLMDSY